MFIEEFSFLVMKLYENEEISKRLNLLSGLLAAIPPRNFLPKSLNPKSNSPKLPNMSANPLEACYEIFDLVPVHLAKTQA